MTKNISLITLIFLCFAFLSKAQNNIGINTTTPDASAALDVQSTTQGMLIPRMNASQRGLIATPATGLLVYQTDAPTGFYFYDGTNWTLLGATAQAYSGILPVANGGTGAASLTGLVLGNGTNAMTGLSGTNSGETINWNNTTGTWQVTGTSNLALGNNAGYDTQGQSAVAMGSYAGQVNQGANSIAMGNTAGYSAQGQSAVAMGSFAGSMNQGVNSIAMGNNAGGNDQGPSAVAMGFCAGNNAQGNAAVAIGSFAGRINQGQSAVAMGDGAGKTNQGNNSVAMGNTAGVSNQAVNSVAIGNAAGQTLQGTNAVAIGNAAGQTSQGANAVAIGNAAGKLAQATNSIILNASGLDLNSSTNGLFIKPIRNASSPNGLLYDPTTGEVTYGASSPCSYSIGQYVPALGGIIFYLDASGCHGLVCATTDQSTGIEWYPNSNYTPPPNTTAFADCVGGGAGNTSMIIYNQGATSNTFAAGVARAYFSSDYYLPSKYELNLMYKNIGPGNVLGLGNNIGSFATLASYWSSTEYGNNNYLAWSQNFGTGNPNVNSKGNPYYVRAVRAF